MFRDRKGKAITPAEWAQLFSLPGYSRIAITRLKNGWEVSTVWLGLALTSELFETMVFRDSDPYLTQRYTTETAALRGHKQIVTQLEKRGLIWAR